MKTDTRIHEEHGAVTVIIALLLMVFIMIAAFAIDGARLYQERRQLQTTADAAALVGAATLPEGDGLAVAAAQAYMGMNPTTYHTGGYDPGAGDQVESTTCSVDGVSYDCVRTTAASPEVELFFGQVFGHDTEDVRARGAAVIGNAAIGGDRLVPWMIRDCPDAYGEGRGFTDENTDAVRAEMIRVGLACPYRFSDDFFNGQTELFLGDASTGNFQGARLSDDGDCPSTPSGFFDGSNGANPYRGFLSGVDSDSWWACAIGPGARLQPQTGGVTGPTTQGLNNRGVNTCMNFASFDQALDIGVVGDGVVSIEEYNPCIMAVVMVVTPNQEPEHSQLRADVPGDIRAMQNPRVVDPNPGDNDQARWRFGRLTQGASDVYLVRRLAFFYLTSREPYRGLFLRAISSEDAVLSGPYDPSAGIYITRLVE